MSAQVQRSTLDKLFKITERGSSVSRELFAGGYYIFYVYPMY